MPHAALWVVQQESSLDLSAQDDRFNAARGFVGGATDKKVEAIRRLKVSMPHAALWVVQQNIPFNGQQNVAVSMPHAALWVMQQHNYSRAHPHLSVSMPHAALWVVQHGKTDALKKGT